MFNLPLAATPSNPPKQTVKVLQSAAAHHGFLVLIGFDAPDKERLTDAQSPHEQLQRSFELTAQSGRALPGLCPLKDTHMHNTHICQNNADSLGCNIPFFLYVFSNSHS